MTTDDILEVQRRAVERGDDELLDAAWAALGYSRRYAFVEVSAWQRERAIARCATELAPGPLDALEGAEQTRRRAG